jgi:hypothetical protein
MTLEPRQIRNCQPGTGKRAVPVTSSRPALTQVAASAKTGSGQFDAPGSSPCGSKAGNGQLASPKGEQTVARLSPLGVRHPGRHSTVVHK